MLLKLSKLKAKKLKSYRSKTFALTQINLIISKKEWEDKYY